MTEIILRHFYKFIHFRAGSVIYKIVDGSSFALIVGDNGYTTRSWEEGVLPGIMYDEENTRACLSWIKKQRAQKDCLGIYCAHSPA